MKARQIRRCRDYPAIVSRIRKDAKRRKPVDLPKLSDSQRVRAELARTYAPLA